MGYFSWNCLACGFSLKECRNCSENNWMAHGVALTPNGTRAIGYYNGYGQLGDTYNLGQQMGNFSVYHKACWELVGKPEYTKQSPHARDQGACHSMHGQPFPLPTLEWIEKAKMWQAIDCVLNAWSHLRADLDMAECEAKFALFTKEGQDRLCREYEADKVARRTRNHDRREAFYNDPNEEALSPPKEEDPPTFLYECITFDYGWLNVVVSRHTGKYD